MKGLVLDAQWDPRPDYAVSDWEKETGKAVTGSSIWRYPKLEVREWPDPQPGPKEVVLGIQIEVNAGDLLMDLSKGQGFEFHVEAAGVLDMSAIVTSRYGLDETVDAIIKSIDRTDGKIMVKPN